MPDTPASATTGSYSTTRGLPSNIADLRERVDRAASLLGDVGNLHELANMLTDAAYAALCLGSERDAANLAARATPITRAPATIMCLPPARRLP